jgi:serine/threonine-protein kinase
VLLIALAFILGGNTPNPPGPTSPTPSSNQGVIAVPNVLALKEADAKKALEQAGLKVGEIKEVAGPEGTVVNATPLPGELVPLGTPVTLFVGSTPSPKPEHGHGEGKGQGNEGD